MSKASQGALGDGAAPAEGNRPSAWRQAWSRPAKAGRRSLEKLLGGPARTRVVVILAGVLALNSADTATVGASASQLRLSLHISNGDIGLLVAVTAAVAAVFSVPFGVLADRMHRIAILATTVTAWGAVMVLTASVGSFSRLLLARLVLGAVTAASGPMVASLVGDYFPAGERGKIYGYVLAGELLGAGAGFVITGDIAGISWRAAFVVLALPTIPLAWALAHLPEPARGGASQLRQGAPRVIGRREIRRSRRAGDAGAGYRDGAPGTARGPDGWVSGAEASDHVADARSTDAQELARSRGILADPDLVLHEDPRRMGIVTMVRYVLGVRTNLVLIVSGACAYFFLAGVETFGLEFARSQYHVEQLAASALMLVVGLGAVLGVVFGGRFGDRLVRRGHLSGRIGIAAVAALCTTFLFVPALLTHSALAALPYITVAGFALTAQNAPIDAARLDIMPPLLWGRAEGVRSLLRTSAQAIAPLAFGGLSDLVGLRTTFGIMLVPFLASGLILLRALRTYPKDVATAAASAKAT